MSESNVGSEVRIGQLAGVAGAKAAAGPPPRIGVLAGIARPSDALLGRLSLVTDRREMPLSTALNADLAIDALARLITEALGKHTTADGRIDMRDIAAHCLMEMGQHQRREGGPDLRSVAAFRLAEISMASLLTEAFERAQKPDGLVDTRDVAARVFEAMKR